MADEFSFLAQEVRACRRCDLRADCIAPVPGRGLVTAPLFLIGQSPGSQEDKVGRAFIGPAGVILHEALAKAGIKDTYITNAVKCHPVGNKKAKVHQRTACVHWLETELALWNPPKDSPKLIVTLGNDAYIALFGREFEKKTLFAEARKRTDLVWEGFPVKVCLHPAAILHSPKFILEFEDEMAEVAETLGIGEGKDIEQRRYFLVAEEEEITGLLREIRGDDPLIDNVAVVGLDTEYHTDGRAIGISISWGRGSAAFIPAGVRGIRALLDWLWDSNKVRLVLHSAQADIPVLCRMAGRPLDSWPWGRTDDTCIAAYVLREPNVGLKDLAAKLGMRMRSFSDLAKTPEEFVKLPLQQQAIYAAADADATLRLWMEIFRDRVCVARPKSDVVE